jgi:hypothetical protein
MRPWGAATRGEGVILNCKGSQTLSAVRPAYTLSVNFSSVTQVNHIY